MNNVIFILFSIVWILTLFLLIFSTVKNRTIYFETEKGFKIHTEEGKCMKRGTRPTRLQKEFLNERKLHPDNWLVTKNCDKYLEVVNKNSGNVRRIKKNA